MAGCCLCLPFVAVVNFFLRVFHRDPGYTELSTKKEAAGESQALVESAPSMMNTPELAEEGTFRLLSSVSGVNGSIGAC